jgi:hypothetical protein
MPQRHRPELSEAVAGERLVGYRRSARTFAQGRTCQHPGCTTRLSIYNSGKLCALHAAFRAPGLDLILAEDPTELAAS